MNTQDLEALKALAEKATPGEWACGRDPSHFDAPELVKSDGAFYVGVKMEDAAFIAAFNPQTALALIERITALEAAAAEARRLALEEALGKVAEEIAACEDERNLRPLNSYHWAFWDRARRTASDIEAAIIALKERP